MSIGQLLGAYRDDVPCDNTSGGYLSASTSEVLKNFARTAARPRWHQAEVGRPELGKDIDRVGAVRTHVGDGVPIMVGANQQSDLATALRAGRIRRSVVTDSKQSPLNHW